MKQISKSSSFPDLCSKVDKKAIKYFNNLPEQKLMNEIINSNSVDSNSILKTKSKKFNQPKNQNENLIHEKPKSNQTKENDKIYNLTNLLESSFNDLNKVKKRAIFNSSNHEKDPLRVIKITEIIEINDSIDKKSRSPKYDSKISNYNSQTSYNSLRQRDKQNLFMSSNYNFNTPKKIDNENKEFTELPITIEKPISNIQTNNLRDEKSNAEIVFEIRNVVNSPDQISDTSINKKPKKFIVKISGRTKSTEPSFLSNKTSSKTQYQHENLIKQPILNKRENLLPANSFKPILNFNPIENQIDPKVESIFDLEKFKSYFNKINTNRSYSMPPNREIFTKVGFSERNPDTDNENELSYNRMDKKNLENKNKIYACSDSEDFVWKYCNNNKFKPRLVQNKNFIRSNSTNFQLDKKNIILNEDKLSSFSLLNDSFIKTDPVIPMRKNKDIDLYQTSLIRNFNKSNRKYRYLPEIGKNQKKVSSYYNNYYSKMSENFKNKLNGETNNSFKEDVLRKKESNETNDDTEGDEDAEISFNDIDLLSKSSDTKITSDIISDRTLNRIHHNNRHALSTFLPIKPNSEQTIHFKAHSFNNTQNNITKYNRRVIFADECDIK